MNSYIIKRYYKVALLIVALGIAGMSLYYSNNLAHKLADEERKNVEQYAIAQRNLIFAESEQEEIFYLQIVEDNSTIPVILQNQDDVLIGKNFDSLKMLDSNYLRGQFEKLRRKRPPIEIEITEGMINRIYYGESKILRALRFYPYVQLGLIGVFLLLAYVAFSYSRRSEQNQVWVGMSKETAHQLGTPISSLMAWMDVLEEEKGPDDMKVVEMKNDVNRLNTITERFSKIGSEPSLDSRDLNEVVETAVHYMEKRSPKHVSYRIGKTNHPLTCRVNVPLFEWVIENVCKNAMDAMKGEGILSVKMLDSKNHCVVEISDTGSGIPMNLHKTIFKPGYTSKRRGWGLGLSLSKRIIDIYHRGHIFVKESSPGEGTTFRIELRKPKK
jgi:two-component system, sporulation sensor kinase D